MHITDLPYEIFCHILEDAVTLNEQHGVAFTYGLSQPPMPLQKPPLQRNLRGPLAPDQLKWDAVASIRRVCTQWHDWALEYTMKNVFVRKGTGSERWAELTSNRAKYGLYELIEKPTGAAVYRDPWGPLRRTSELLAAHPQAAAVVRRMWFNGFYEYETNLRIAAALAACPYLRSVSLPWTTVRHLGPQQWRRVLGLSNGVPLESLELLTTDLPEAQASQPANQVDLQPLKSGLVNFSQLRRLKIFGDTSFMPIVDEDLEDISRTATNLEEFQLSCNSTVSIRGVMAIVKSSQSTLRVLDHSPRANDGFSHPHPGAAGEDEHICDVLAHCPRLTNLSVSIPSMCAALFAHRDVRWEGDCQVRAAHLCGHADLKSNTPAAQDALQALLDESRALIAASAASIAPRALYVELFFAECIFEPSARRVHGDFEPSEIVSSGLWPGKKYPSGKGPYGATGFYGKEIAMFEGVDEHEFMTGVQRHWVPLAT